MDDPLSFTIPSSGVDTTFVIAPAADYRFQITESNYAPNKFDENVLDWVPKFVTVEPITAVDGREIPVNTQFYPKWNFSLGEAKDTKHPGAWLKSLCAAFDAIHGTDVSSRPDITKDLLDSSVGKHVIGTVILDTDKQGVTRNKIQRLKKA